MQKTNLKRSYLCCILMLFFCCGSLYAQQKTIKGTVTDQKGETLIGVSVAVKGAAVGTVTDIDGNYTLSVAADAKILVATYIGMKTTEVPISGAVVDITMAEDHSELDEVVVIGYGTVKKRDLTGSVASVGERQLKDLPVATAAEAITGKLPGVQVTTTEGSPDAEIKIRVRGGGSITQSNEPLYIVDGFPMDNISSIAPSEIQSIDVLKDASSTAIYGSRGANGVILITTKTPQEGKFTVSYNGYIGFKKIAKTLDVLNPYQFAQSQYERAILTDKVSSEYEPYFGIYKDIDLYKSMKGTDWQDEIFGNTGTTRSHSVTISGGTKVISYNVNYNRISDDAIMIMSDYERDNVSLKLKVEPLKWLKLDFNGRYSDTKVRGAGANDVSGSEKSTSDSRLKNSVVYTPIELKSFVADESDPEAIANLYPPDQTIRDNDRFKKSKSFNMNGGVSIIPIKGLTIRSEIGADSGFNDDYRFYGTTSYYSKNHPSHPNMPASEMATRETFKFRNTNTINYTKDNFIKDHNLSLLIGEETIVAESKKILDAIGNYPIFFDSKLAWKFPDLGTAYSSQNYYEPKDKLLSFFGRLNYDYLGRYLATVTFRADGSTKFASGNQWGYFPSVALAWRISDEKFMESSANWLSNLKLRLSYGEAGNNNITSLAWNRTYKPSSLVYIPPSVGSSVLTTGNIMPNPNLTWETTTTRNAGLDFGFFNGRLSGTIDVYKNNTTDLLIKYGTSGTGYTYQWRNIGETSNRGAELSLNAVLVDNKDFSLNFGFNISANKNRVEKLGNLEVLPGNEKWTSQTEASNSYGAKVGDPVGIMYGYVTDGMYSIDDFKWNGSNWEAAHPDVVDNKTITGDSWGPGALKLKDLDNDGEITDKDRTKIGDANPKHFGAFNISATYKGFDLTANFNWVYGNDIYNANKIEFTTSYYKYRNTLSFMAPGNSFRHVDPSTGLRVTDATALADLNKNAKIWSAPMGRNVFHSWAVEDGSFLRFNNLTVGYTLPRSLLSKVYVQSLRFYFSAYNLYTWTNYSGYDPEVDTRRNSDGAPTPGVDYSAYPKSRSYNFGVNLTF